MAKITTADCIAGIVRLSSDPDLSNPRNWKRTYKSKYEIPGSGYSSIVCDLREFRNTKNPDAFAIVMADDSQIHLVRALLRSTEMKQLIKDRIARETWLDLDAFYPCQLGFPLEIVPYRNDLCDPENGPGEYELLDMENLEVIAISDSSITVEMGGDWQRPFRVTFNLMNDGLLYCDHNETIILEQGEDIDDRIDKINSTISRMQGASEREILDEISEDTGYLTGDDMLAFVYEEHDANHN